MQDDFVALFAYDRWANRKVLDACNARGTQVTEAGVNKLKQRLPEIKVGFGPAPK